jgi:hypothetical protein
MMMIKSRVCIGNQETVYKCNNTYIHECITEASPGMPVCICLRHKFILLFYKILLH